MKNTVKIACCFFAFCIIVFSIPSCGFLNYSGYSGEHTDMYAVAVNNIFGVQGHLSNGEVIYDPEIHIVETDNYGRTLFFYSEYYDDSLDSQINYGMAFVVMQNSKDGYAYYYADECYIPYYDTTSDWNSISEQIGADYFEQLKEANDWNCELNEEKCAKIKVTNKKANGRNHLRDYEFDEIIYPYEVKNGYTGEDDSFCKFSVYCEADSYGRELYYVYGMTMNTLENGEKEFGYYEYAIILNADGTCSDNGIVRIPTPEDSFTIIKELKLSNNWNLSN